jgi:shikimate dehydrogenase
MIKLGLIGYPLSHSLSPVIHTAALESCSLNGSYSLFPVQPDDKQGLQAFVERIRDSDITGLNVTIPHKQNIIPFLDELTTTANAIGAVNTIFMRGDRLIGENTDAPGFLADLERFLTSETQRNGPFNALVLGAGGSARAVVYALLNAGWKVTIAARRLEQAQRLADSLANYQLSRSIPVGPITVSALSNLTTSYTNLQFLISLVVNTTPVGMMPNITQSPWPEHVPFAKDAAIYDLVYNPRETKLVLHARSQGRPATTGLGMLIEQAALAFEIWTGIKPSREVMMEAVHQTAH